MSKKQSLIEPKKPIEHKSYYFKQHTSGHKALNGSITALVVSTQDRISLSNQGVDANTLLGGSFDDYYQSAATTSKGGDETHSVLASPDCISFGFSPTIKSNSYFDCFGTTKPIALISSFEATLEFDKSNKPIELATEDPSSHATPLIFIPLTRASKFGCS